MHKTKKNELIKRKTYENANIQNIQQNFKNSKS